MTTSIATADLIAARERASMTPGVPFITQAILAAEMGISERSLWAFEHDQARLPRSLNAGDYLQAVGAIKQRFASEKQAAS